jgi:uncharacterized protein (DUF427 family)
MSDGHRITINKAPQKIAVKWHGHTVAESSSALELHEASYPPVIYIPRADADMSYFERTQRQTTCPFKGVANYFSLKGDGAKDDNSVWTYETPKDGVSEITGYLAFYPDKVEIVRG